VGFRLRREAEACIEAIAPYIAADSPSAAQRWYDEMYRRSERLGEMPGMGVARPKVQQDLCTFSVGNYLIVCRQVCEGAEIVRVVHGARQWQDLLQGILVSFGRHWQAWGQLPDRDMYCYKYEPAHIL